jgi:hypothetical protein
MMLGMTTVPLTHELIQPHSEELHAYETLQTAPDGSELKLVLFTALGVHMRLWLLHDSVRIECRRKDNAWTPGTVNDLDELLASAEDEGQLSRIKAPHAMTPHRRIIRESRRTRHGIVNGLKAMQKDVHELLVLAAAGRPVGAELLQLSLLTMQLATTAKVNDAQLALLEDPPE